MPVKVQMVDSAQGLPLDAIKRLLELGFVCFPKVSISTPSVVVATLGQPQPDPVQIVDVWVGPMEAYVPSSIVALALTRSWNEMKGDLVTLNYLSMVLLGMPFKELENIAASMPTDDPEKPR